MRILLVSALVGSLLCIETAQGEDKGASFTPGVAGVIHAIDREVGILTLKTREQETVTVRYSLTGTLVAHVAPASLEDITNGKDVKVVGRVADDHSSISARAVRSILKDPRRRHTIGPTRVSGTWSSTDSGFSVTVKGKSLRVGTDNLTRIEAEQLGDVESLVRGTTVFVSGRQGNLDFIAYQITIPHPTSRGSPLVDSQRASDGSSLQGESERPVPAKVTVHEDYVPLRWLPIMEPLRGRREARVHMEVLREGKPSVTERWDAWITIEEVEGICSTTMCVASHGRRPTVDVPLTAREFENGRLFCRYSFHNSAENNVIDRFFNKLPMVPFREDISPFEQKDIIIRNRQGKHVHTIEDQYAMRKARANELELRFTGYLEIRNGRLFGKFESESVPRIDKITAEITPPSTGARTQ